MSKQWTKEEVASWPPLHKECRGCSTVLPFEKFSKHSRGKFGLDNKCKRCKSFSDAIRRGVFSFDPDIVRNKNTYYSKANRKKVANLPEQERIKRLYIGAKARAKRDGIEFLIDLEDIVVPTVCPVFGISLSFTDIRQDSSPSLDRLDSSKGYIKGNVFVISWKANRLKSNASVEEVRQLLAYMENYTV